MKASYLGWYKIEDNNFVGLYSKDNKELMKVEWHYSDGETLEAAEEKLLKKWSNKVFNEILTDTTKKKIAENIL